MEKIKTIRRIKGSKHTINEIRELTKKISDNVSKIEVIAKSYNPYESSAPIIKTSNKL